MNNSSIASWAKYNSAGISNYPTLLHKILALNQSSAKAL